MKISLFILFLVSQSMCQLSLQDTSRIMYKLAYPYSDFYSIRPQQNGDKLYMLFAEDQVIRIFESGTRTDSILLSDYQTKRRFRDFYVKDEIFYLLDSKEPLVYTVGKDRPLRRYARFDRKRTFPDSVFAQVSVPVLLDYNWFSNWNRLLVSTDKTIAFFNPNTTPSGFSSIYILRPLHEPEYYVVESTIEYAIEAGDSICFFSGDQLHYYSYKEGKLSKRSVCSDYQGKLQFCTFFRPFRMHDTWYSFMVDRCAEETYVCERIVSSSNPDGCLHCQRSDPESFLSDFYEHNQAGSFFEYLSYSDKAGLAAKRIYYSVSNSRIR
ncbi:MAG: hypothetical protein ACK5QE_11630 [Sphingobacteriia bacterium]